VFQTKASDHHAIEGNSITIDWFISRATMIVWFDIEFVAIVIGRSVSDVHERIRAMLFQDNIGFT
jgi:hypothetical protein